jgi:CDP-diacylglycerol---glycerol-3-phosphate 3-phosphatidyltransferase
MAGSQVNLPNIITTARIAACPAIFFLALQPSVSSRLIAFALFLVAALSDLWDGYLARKLGLITDIGKLLDPLADKLLLLSTFVPFYMISNRPGDEGLIPWWGELPMWVMIVIFGRELAVTIFRQWAARRNVVIAAGRSGKYKAFVQNLFSGGLLLWYPLQDTATNGGWSTLLWQWFTGFHSVWIGLTLAVALFLTVYSMFDYFWSYRSLMGVWG